MKRATFFLTGCFVVAGFCGSSLFAADREDRKTAVAVKKALDFLARSQDRRGFWTGSGGEYRVALTALAANALLCEGSTTNTGRYGDNVRRATRFLLRIARKDGLIGLASSPKYTYGHAFSMVFLAGVYGQEEDEDQRKELKRVLTKAVEFSVKAQTTQGGWGYVSAKDGNDFDEGSTVPPQMQGLRACQAAGIAVPREAIARAVRYIHKCQSYVDGGICYSSKSRGASRPAISAGALVSLVSANTFAAAVPEDTPNDGRIRVLLIASAPTRDYRYVSRFLYRHRGFHVDAWLQSVDASAVGRVSQNVDRVLAGLPKSLSRYDTIIGFDPNWRRLTAAQRVAISDWTVKKQGGLIVQGGDVNTSQLADFHKELRAIHNLYPVNLASTLAVREIETVATQAWSPKWTAAGRASRVFRCGTDGDISSASWKRLSLFRGCLTKGAKPDAQIYARYLDFSVANDYGLQILFAFRKSGTGRVLYIGSSEMWRLRAVDPASYWRFWLQAIRMVKRRQIVIENDTKAEPEGNGRRTISSRAARLSSFCKKTISPSNRTVPSGHWEFAHYYYAQFMYLAGGEASRRYAKSVREQILKTQSHDGSWSNGQIGPVYATALNATVLQLANQLLPLYGR